MASGKAVVRMLECDVLRSFVRGDQRTREWKAQKVRLVDDGAEVRCTYCHADVSIVRQKKGKGQPDHVQHLSANGPTTCKGGEPVVQPQAQQEAASPGA